MAFAVHGCWWWRRDLKLENWLLEGPGSTAGHRKNHLKLIDFGLSKFFNKNELMAQSVGSLYYVVSGPGRQAADEASRAMTCQHNRGLAGPDDDRQTDTASRWSASTPLRQSLADCNLDNAEADETLIFGG